jgi:hypothetical protein
MAKLFTNHDPFHIHKTMGLLALLNFAYRLMLIVNPWRGGSAFCHANNETCTTQHIYVDVACVLLHGALSWSSLLLPVPRKRNFNSPMIWTEFRWHSILFATRSILGTIVSILGWWPEHLVANYGAKVALVMGTCFAADYVTAKYGCTTQRTTNAMAYPEYVSTHHQQRIKLNYSMAQMSATLSCVTEDPTLSFLPLYAIQGAAFLMTLRRKNWISTRTVHFNYQVQLCAAYLPTITALGQLLLSFGITIRSSNYHLRIQEQLAQIFLLGGLHLIAGYLRIDCQASKAVTWGSTIFLLVLFQQNEVLQNVLLWFHSHPVGIAYIIFCHVNEYQRVFRHYFPILCGEKAMQYYQWHEKKGGDKTEDPNFRQSLIRDMLDYDMLEYPDRRQRFLLVLCVLFATHFQGIEMAHELFSHSSHWAATTAGATFLVSS